jgi:hypothetical protein
VTAVETVVGNRTDRNRRRNPRHEFPRPRVLNKRRM